MYLLRYPEKFEEINGLSISPKKEFNICKIWLRNYNTNKDTNYKYFLKEYSPQFDYSRALYKKHDVQ